MKSTIETAMRYAMLKHENSRNYDGWPYINHVLQVYAIAFRHNLSENVLCGCLLHDVLEETPTTYTEILNNFGRKVAEIVYCCTDELGRNRKERKEKTYPKTKSNPDAILVKICDRIANLKNCIETSNFGLMQMYGKEHPDFCTMFEALPAGYDGLISEYTNLIT